MSTTQLHRAALQEAEEAFLSWRKQEEKQWRDGLHKKETALLQSLQREARAEQGKRESELRAHKRSLAELESHLRRRVGEVQLRQTQLQHAEAELAARKDAVELHAKRSVALAQADLERAVAAARAELLAAQSELSAHEGRAQFLGERLRAAESMQIQHEQQATQLRQAAVQASTLAVTLQAEADRLEVRTSELQREYDEAQRLVEERQQQAVAARHALEATRAAAERAKQVRVRERFHAQRQRQLQLQQQYKLACERERSEGHQTGVQAQKLQLARLMGLMPTDEITDAERRDGGGRGAQPLSRPTVSTGDVGGGAYSERERLQRMREELLSSGVYAEGDRVPAMLAEKIARLAES